MSAPRAHRQLRFLGSRSQLEVRTGVCFDLVVSSEPASTSALRLLVSVTAVSATQIGKVRTSSSRVLVPDRWPLLRSRRRLLPFGLDRRPRVTFSRTRTNERPGVDGLPPRAAAARACARPWGRPLCRSSRPRSCSHPRGRRRPVGRPPRVPESSGPAAARRWSSHECRPRSSATTRGIFLPWPAKLRSADSVPWVLGVDSPNGGVPPRGFR